MREHRLSAVLSEFARTMVTDFPIQAILDRLVHRIIEILPVTAAGVTLIGENREPHYIAASDESALRFESLQTRLGQGPCLAAYLTGQPVAVPDVANDQLFSLFSPAAAEQGLAAVFTFPLRHADLRIGALDLYRDTPGGLAAEDMVAAQTLADVAAAYLLNAEARDQARTASDRFHHSALHDPLTGLPNRLLLEQRLEHAAQRATRSPSTAAVLFADLDDFKQINDLHGHIVGDELLCAVARRLHDLIRPGDTLARVSGDEFVILCEDLAQPADGEDLAARIDAAFSAPFELTEVELQVTASVGMAYAGRGQDITDQLIADADTAMYQAKRRGGAQHQIIDLQLARAATARSSLEAALRSALRANRLELAYQPIVRTRDGLIVGAEALLRWNDPHRGQVPPVEMIAAAEHSALIIELGAWALDRACRDRALWLHQNPDTPIAVAVNVTARQLMSPDFTATVARTLTRYHTDPASLILEITETSLIEDGRWAAAVLADLNTIGIRIALDDFGTGYSSLSHLRQLPVQILKIDQSFTSEITHVSTSAAIIEAVVTLAHTLGLTVTAEGVETEQQHRALRTLGCDHAQGYYYARPMDAVALARLRTASNGRPPRANRSERSDRSGRSDRSVSVPSISPFHKSDDVVRDRQTDAAARSVPGDPRNDPGD
jgi:diguanylate cyclase (GGDEF)-like protein